jgi:leader peptidase (prepilin peptidase)/N-methyltransferase
MFIIVALVVGWIAAWVVNYIADVLPVNRRFSQPTCPNCQKVFPWRDYLLMRNCPSCGIRRSLRTLLVQAILTVAIVLFSLFKPLLPFPLVVLLLVFLAIVFVIDIEHRLVLHPISWAGAILGLGIGIYMHSLVDTLIGGVCGFVIMLLFYYAGVWYMRTLAKRRGIPSDEVALGFGDVNLAGILGLILGWPSIILGLTFTVVTAGLFSLILIIVKLASKKYTASLTIPYAPFLILSTFILFIH